MVKGELGVPGRKVSGDVPNEKVADVTCVLAVTPERLIVKVAGPMTYGLKLPKPPFAFVYVPPFAIAGAIISLG